MAHFVGRQDVDDYWDAAAAAAVVSSIAVSAVVSWSHTHGAVCSTTLVVGLFSVAKCRWSGGRVLALGATVTDELCLQLFVAAD